MFVIVDIKGPSLTPRRNSSLPEEISLKPRNSNSPLPSPRPVDPTTCQKVNSKFTETIQKNQNF